MEDKNYRWAVNVPIPSEVEEYGEIQTITYRIATHPTDAEIAYGTRAPQPASSTVTLVLSNGHVWKADEWSGTLHQVDVTQYTDNPLNGFFKSRRAPAPLGEI